MNIRKKYRHDYDTRKPEPLVKMEKRDHRCMDCENCFGYRCELYHKYIMRKVLRCCDGFKKRNRKKNKEEEEILHEGN